MPGVVLPDVVGRFERLQEGLEETVHGPSEPESPPWHDFDDKRRVAAHRIVLGDSIRLQILVGVEEFPQPLVGVGAIGAEVLDGVLDEDVGERLELVGDLDGLLAVLKERDRHVSIRSLDNWRAPQYVINDM